MATAGSIVADLLVRTGSFETDIDRATRNAERRFREMEKTINQWSTRITAGVGIATAAFSAWAVHMADMGREVDRLSTIASTSVETFQRWTYAARTVGIEQEKLADILKDVQDKVGDFLQTGGGAMADFFENIAPRIGVTASQFRKLSGPEALGLYVQSLEKAGLSQSEMTFYMEALASDATALLPLLRDNAKGLNELATEADRLGLVMSGQMVASAKELDANLKRLQGITAALSVTFGNQIIPVMNQFITNAIDATLETDELNRAAEALAGDKKLPDWLAAVAMGLARVVDVGVFAVRTVDAISSSFRVVAADIELAAKRLNLGEDTNWLTSKVFPKEAEENSKALAAAVEERNRIVEEANKKLADLWNKPANLYEQAMFDAINNPKILATLDAIEVKGSKVGDSFRRNAKEAREFEIAVATLTATHLPEVKALEDLHKSLATLQAAQRAGIIVGQNYTKALESINLAYAKQVNDLLPESIKKAQEQVKAAREQQKQLEQQLRTFGMAESAVLALAAADTDSAIAKLETAKANEVANGATAERIKHVEAEIQVLRELRDLQLGSAGLQGQLEWREQQRQQWEAWASDVEQIFNRVGQSLTDAIFEGGKSGKELLKDIFKSLTFNVLINPVMGAMQGWVTNQLGGLFGVQNPQQGGGILGTAQNLYSSYNAVSGGLSNTLGNAAQWLGQKVGSEALTSFGLGLSGTTAATGIASIGAGLGASLGTSIGTSAAAMTTTSFSAALSGGALVPGLGVGAAGGGVGAGIGAAGAAGGAAAGGAAGIGSAIGAALPWIGGALAIGGLLGGGLFDREPTTRREQRTQVEYSGGALGITSRDDRVQAGTDAAVAQMTAAAIESANSLFRQIGIDAAIDSFHAILASSYQGDRDGVASGGRLRIGDRLVDIGIPDDENPTIKGFGGWSSAETLPRLATDIQLTVLEAFQAASDQLPSVLATMLADVDVRSLGEAEAQALAERFTMLTQGASAFLAAIEQMPFDYLRDVTFDAAVNMVQFAGGIDNLLAARQTYYDRYYSEQEKFEHSVNQLSQALSGVGVVMPELTGSTDDMLASYRALVESLDLNTEAGQQAYVTLMQNAGAFAEVAQYAGQAASAVEGAARSLADIARERESLERQLLQLQGDTAELRRRELEALDESNHALQRYIWSLQDQRSAWDAAVAAGESAFSALSRSIAAEKTRLQRESESIASALRNSISAASTTVNELTSLTGRLTSTVQRMIGQTLDDGRNREWAQERIDRALSVAKLTGVMPQGEDFERALEMVAQPSEGLFNSFEDYQADFLRTAHTVSELNELAEGQLSTERRALKALEDQLSNSQQWYQAEMERLDLMLEQERQRLDVAIGTYETVLTIPEALAGIRDAIANIQLVTPPAAGGGGGSGGGGGVGTGSGPGASWDDLYLSAKLAELQNKGAVSHGIDWQSGTINDLAAVFASEGLTPRLHYELYGKDEGIDEWMKRLPGFAVGTNYVPYDMVARIHEGERIIPATDNRKLMQMLARGVDRDNTIRLLQQEIRELRLMMERKLDGVERNTGEVARTNRQMVEQRQIVQVEGPVATVLIEDRTA